MTETKELKIQIPEGYEIDKEKSTFENIVFKEKDTKPRSWEEYLCKGNHPNKLWFINPTYKITDGIGSTAGNIKDCDLNKSHCYMSAYLPSKELAESFLAMMQLMSLRQAWIEGWDSNQLGYAIMLDVKRDIIVSYSIYYKTLTFPDRNMAVDFMNCFKDLLKIAKPLI